ncbi:MAG: HEPN domain-containing protein [Euryarchaeota archaeon]|nr:HEPN domain-containing protein [Euryarchaeota archaeon]
MLEKAAQDEFVMDKLMSDPASPDEAIGFHGQQAAEKSLKAVLADAGITYPITHRLAELIDLTNDAGLSFPESLDDIRFLTPFAVEFRYDILPKEQESPFDRESSRELVKKVRMWAEGIIKQ